MGNKKVDYIIRRVDASYTLPSGTTLKDIAIKPCYVCGGKGRYIRKKIVRRCVMCWGDGVIRYIYFYTGGKNK